MDRGLAEGVLSVEWREVPRNELPSLDGVLLCHNLIVNALSGNPSFIESFTVFQPPMFPAHFAFFVVAIVRGAPEGGILTIKASQGNAWSQRQEVQVGPVAEPRNTLVFAATQMTALLVEGADVKLELEFEGAHFGGRSFPVIQAPFASRITHPEVRK
jgi:hypothetical protein